VTLRISYRKLFKLYDCLAKRILNERKATILCYIAKHPGCNYSDIARDVFGMESYKEYYDIGGTLAYHLKDLAKRGFIVKKNDRYYVTDVGYVLTLSLKELKEIGGLKEEIEKLRNTIKSIKFLVNNI